MGQLQLKLMLPKGYWPQDVDARRAHTKQNAMGEHDGKQAMAENMHAWDCAKACQQGVGNSFSDM